MRISLCTLLILAFSLCEAQNWTNFNTGNSGLLTNTVTGITVDKTGQVWVSFGFNWPPKGLQKFDGTNWTTFNTANCPLPSDDVLCLATDAQNKLWIGTRDAGLILYDGVNWTIYDTANSSLFSNYIQGLYLDPNNFLWIDHGQEGAISVFDGTQFMIYTQQNLAIPNYCLTDLYFEDTLYAWMSFDCNGGIARFNLHDSTWYYLTGANSAMPSNYLSSIDKDKNGNLWMGYSLGYYGVSKYDGSSVSNYTPFSSQAWVYDLAADTLGNVYVGTRSKGLYKYDGGNWALVPSPLPDSGTTMLVYCDPYNRIWWGEQFTGLWVSDIGNGIGEDDKGIGFSVYPNPANDELNLILYLSEKENIDVKLFNSLGELISERKLYARTGSFREKLFVGGINEGVYLINIKTSKYSRSKVILIN